MWRQRARRKAKGLYVTDRQPAFPWRPLLRTGLWTLSLLALLFSLGWFATAEWRRDQVQRFERAMKVEHFDEALAAYRAVQVDATTLRLPSKEREPLQAFQRQIEALVAERSLGIAQAVLDGGLLAAEDKVFLEGMKELSAASLAPFLYEQTRALLDQSLSFERWEHLLHRFTEVKGIAQVAQGLTEQTPCLKAYIPRIAKARANETAGPWDLAWQQWLDLSESPEACRFVREYATEALLSYQEAIYQDLLDLADARIEAEQYETARQMLSKVHEVFPERSEVRERLAICEAKIPANLVQWFGMVEVVAIRPLVVDLAHAFQASKDPAYAANTLLTAGEFQAMLRALHAKDYVLISTRQFEANAKGRVTLRVPRGKKPMILLFDRWEYSILNQICGSNAALEQNAQGELVGVLGERSGRELDALSLLEDFLKTHPDFSFDGAKACLAFNASESLFGHVLHAEQMAEQNKVRARIGWPLLSLTEEDFARSAAKLEEIFSYLQRKGWDFASAGYVGRDMGRLEPDERVEEVDRLQSLLAPYTGPLTALAFPNGSHVYQEEGGLAPFLDRGLRLFFGQGPKGFHFIMDRYVHADRCPINGFTMQAPAWRVERFFEVDQVIDRPLRLKRPAAP